MYTLVDIEIETDVDVKTEVDPSVIMDELFISSIIAYALIDSRSIHSNELLKFVRRLGRSLDQMSIPFGTTLSSGEVMYSNRILRACPIVVENSNFL